MKAEERQDLKTNDLASLWQRHGNKVLLGLAAVFLVLAYVRYQRGQTAQRQQQTMAALAAAWDGAEQVARLSGPGLPASMTGQRGQMIADVNQSAQLVLNDPAVTPAQAANALLAQGQMYWTLAHAEADADAPVGAVVGAATQPASQPAGPTPAQARDLAATAYGEVVGKYAGESVPVTVARYALAAIAEERGDTEAARQQYKALIETPNFTTPVTGNGGGVGGNANGNAPAGPSMAEARLAMLDAAAKPALLLPASRPAAVSASADLIQSLDLGLPAGPTSPAVPPATAPAGARPTTQP